MLTGAACGIFMVLGTLVVDRDYVLDPLAIFASGALFGKGYGIWEQRQRAGGRS